jgi:hypothetical protein
MQIKQENNVKSRRFQAKTSAWWLEKRSAITANNFDFMIPDNELTKTHSQSSFIYSQSNLWYSSKKYYIDAAVSLLTNIIPKGIIKQIWCLCPGSNQRMSLWKNNKVRVLDSNSSRLHENWVIAQSCTWQGPSWGNWLW